VPLASLLRESIKFTLTNLEVVASTPAETGVRTRKKVMPRVSVREGGVPSSSRCRCLSVLLTRRPLDAGGQGCKRRQAVPDARAGFAARSAPERRH